MDVYDAGLLNDFGGGNVDWWHDYIRSELGAAHDHYQSQCDDLIAAHVAEAVRPFAQAIVGLDGIWKDGYICPFCESGYGSYADSKWTWDHKPGCIVPQAQQALAALAPQEGE